jgi:transcriptional regulator with XRE-family HTH domain
MAILTRLRAVREDALMSQADLAKRSGVAQPTISHLEQGRDARFMTARKLAKALGVTPAELRGPEPVTRGYTGDSDAVGTQSSRRAATTQRPPAEGLAHALEQAERCRRNDDLAGAQLWEQIAARIAASIAEFTLSEERVERVD